MLERATAASFLQGLGAGHGPGRWGGVEGAVAHVLGTWG